MRARSGLLWAVTLALLGDVACTPEPAKDAGSSDAPLTPPDAASSDLGAPLDAATDAPDVVVADASIVNASVDAAALVDVDPRFIDGDAADPPDDPLGPTGSARCDLALPLPDRYRTALDLSAATATAPACGDAGVEGGPVLWMRTVVPPRTVLHLAVSPYTTERALIRLYAGCDAGVCLGHSATVATATRNDDLWWTNLGDAPRDVVYAVGSATPGARPAMNFTRTLAPLPPNRTCATATALEPGTRQETTYFPDGAEHPAACDSFGDPPPALWYRLHVPARSVTNVVAFPSYDGGPPAFAVRAFTACGGACFPADHAAATTNLRWTNAGPETDVLLALTPLDPGPDQRLRVSAAALSAPDNIACDRAFSLADPSDAHPDSTDVAVAPMPACAGLGLSRAYFYRVTVPAGRELVATARGPSTSAPAPVLAALAACGDSACLAHSSTAAQGLATLRYTNPAAADREVVIAAATPDGAEPGYSISASTQVAADHGRCASALALTDGVPVTAQRLVDGRDPPPACAAVTSPSLFYAVHVGPGEALTVAAREVSSSQDAPHLTLLDGCGATAACVAGAVAFTSAPYVTWTNAGPAARDLVVALGAADGASANGRVTVTASVRRPAYRVTAIAAACDDMTGAETVPVGTNFLGSDYYAPHALPFAFAYFGEAMRYWTPARGTLSLAATTADGPRGPDLLASNGQDNLTHVVAPLATNLDVDRADGIRTRLVDAPRRHVTVQWNNVTASVGAVRTDPATFQAWLLESGEIEFHYCALTAALSGRAAVGVQGGASTSMVRYSPEHALVSGSGLRFTPVAD